MSKSYQNTGSHLPDKDSSIFHHITRLDELFRKIAARYPLNLALEYGDQKITFKELDKATDLLALQIIEKSDPSTQVIGICFERSVELIISLLAVLKAGYGYVPYDPSYPQSRINLMLENSKVPFVITSTKFNSAFANQNIINYQYNPNELKNVKLDSLSAGISNKLRIS